ncbi:MAG TPA: PEP-CTERM sorting domain-containing protein, partial [Sphingomicrobium sp.]|nr:PEP-CTERM sorting domain-containing protein [Sphingomicrobium sp.]
MPATPACFRSSLYSLAGAFGLLTAASADAKSILFVGNSFTFGSNSPVRTYRTETVTDLNKDGMGGVPALFRAFADQMGLGWHVSLETAAGQNLEWHWNNKRQLLDRKWDAVVLQEYSTLDPRRPGDSSKTVEYAGRLADMFRSRSPNVKLSMTATWSRPNLTYPKGERWSGQPIERMAKDIRRGY